MEGTISKIDKRIEASSEKTDQKLDHIRSRIDQLIERQR